MKYYLLAFFCLCCLSLIAIEGTYDVTGFDPYDNENYRGICKIVKLNDIVYTSDWYEDTGDVYRGTGLKTNDQISFVFLNKNLGEKKRFIGLQNYTIHGDALFGSWIFLGQTKVGTEKMQKKK